MGQEGKIIDYLGENKFVLLLPEEKEYDGNPGIDNIQVAHDYVRFTGNSHFQLTPKAGDRDYNWNPRRRGACNWISSSASVTIGIRDMIDIVMPYLNKHEYLQKDHIKDRVHVKDDEYFRQYDLDKPRYLKGEKYPAYAYTGAIIEYYDKEAKERMVSFRRNGSDTWNTVTFNLFEEIKDGLKLMLKQDENKRRKNGN